MRDVHKTIEAVWKIESTRLIAAIARVIRDIGIAEELAQDALITDLAICDPSIRTRIAPLRIFLSSRMRMCRNFSSPSGPSSAP